MTDTASPGPQPFDRYPALMADSATCRSVPPPPMGPHVHAGTCYLIGWTEIAPGHWRAKYRGVVTTAGTDPRSLFDKTMN